MTFAAAHVLLSKLLPQCKTKSGNQTAWPMLLLLLLPPAGFSYDVFSSIHGVIALVLQRTFSGAQARVAGTASSSVCVAHLKLEPVLACFGYILPVANPTPATHPPTHKPTRPAPWPRPRRVVRRAGGRLLPLRPGAGGLGGLPPVLPRGGVHRGRHGCGVQGFLEIAEGDVFVLSVARLISRCC